DGDGRVSALERTLEDSVSDALGADADVVLGLDAERLRVEHDLRAEPDVADLARARHAGSIGRDEAPARPAAADLEDLVTDREGVGDAGDDVLVGVALGLVHPLAVEDADR